jgi:ADP-ribose pyrophosphatase YjhB (NUDIX family)
MAASVYLSLGAELVAAAPDKSICQQLRAAVSPGQSLRVHVEKRGHRVIFSLDSDGVPMYHSEAINTLRHIEVAGGVRVGVFPLVFNQYGEMLFGEKNTHTSIWFPMGGQARADETLEQAAIARLADNCHLELPSAGKLLMAYESVFVGPAPLNVNYHNVMLFFTPPTYRGDDSADPRPETHVVSTAWIPLLVFWKHRAAGELASMPCIEIVIRTIIEQGMSQLEIDQVIYEQYKNAQPAQNDQILFDLTFLSKVESCEESAGIRSLVEETCAELLAQQA